MTENFSYLRRRIARLLRRPCQHLSVTADILDGDFHGGPGDEQAVQWCRRCGAYRRVFDVYGQRSRYSEWTETCS